MKRKDFFKTLVGVILAPSLLAKETEDTMIRFLDIRSFGKYILEHPDASYTIITADDGEDNEHEYSMVGPKDFIEKWNKGKIWDFSGLLESPVRLRGKDGFYQEWDHSKWEYMFDGEKDEWIVLLSEIGYELHWIDGKIVPIKESNRVQKTLKEVELEEFSHTGSYTDNDGKWKDNMDIAYDDDKSLTIVKEV